MRAPVGDQVDLRLRRGIARDARAARRQGRQRRRDDARARARAGPCRLHDHHRGVRRVHARRRHAARRACRGGRRGAGAPGGAGRQAARRSGRPAAGLRAQRRARLDAGDDGHRPEPRAQRRSPSRASPRAPATRASPGTPTAGSCRCSATSCAAFRARASRTRSPRIKRERGVTLDTELDADALRELTRRFQALYDFPADPREQLEAGDRGRVRLLDGRARGRLPADQRHPRRLGHRGQRPADGLRQQGPDVGLRRGVLARRGHRRARAERRLPGRRAGRGRRLRRAHAARPVRAGRLDAGGARRAVRDPAHARAPLQGHAGHRVHRRGGAPVHAADAQRQAPGAGRGALRRRRRRGGAADAAPRRSPRSTRAR